jgi:hypothetical protein
MTYRGVLDSGPGRQSPVGADPYGEVLPKPVLQLPFGNGLTWADIIAVNIIVTESIDGTNLHRDRRLPE